ncbi:MAG TPA: MBL fold metallo-hydrolase [Dehalococcoidia bacterium]|nr:MBL fold metallo-hydrolase [Dehalococcoidia bacterium]
MGYWFSIGQLQLLVVSDGLIRQDAGATFGLVPRVMWERHVPDLDDKHRLPVGLNSLLIRSPGKTVLVDTGCGAKTARAPGAMDIEHTGALLANLHAEGIAPEDIDIVLNTHLHFDHSGGNTTDSDGALKPTFPNARYILQKGEWDAATHPNERTRGTYLEENIAPLDEARAVDLVEGDTEVVPGVRMLRAPGHTEDHVVVEVESEGEYALYIGELSQHPVQLERLAWISAFDIMPLVSLETKKRFIQKSVEKDATIVSVHHAYPGVGRVVLTDGKRKWVETSESGAAA